MNDQELKSLWKSQPLDADTVSLDAVRGDATGFHAAILRRNRLEELACYLVMLIFGVLAWLQETTTLRAGCLLFIPGTLTVLYQLLRRAAIRALPPQELASTYVGYFRAELGRQRDALRTIWLWYVAPAVPGVVLLLWGMAEKDPSGFPWLPMAAMFVLPFAVVVWMNLKAAHALQKKIDELDASAI